MKTLYTFSTRRALLGLVAASCLAMATGPVAAAPGYPNRPIRMVVPFPPGGATDVVSRRMAMAMDKELGQPIVIDNKGGAGAIIGAEPIQPGRP